MSVSSVLGTLAGDALNALLDPLDFIKLYLPMGHQDRLSAAENALNALSREIDELAEQLNNELTLLTASSAPEYSATRIPRTGRFPGVLNTNQVSSWRDAVANFCAKIWGSAKDMYGGRGLPATRWGWQAWLRRSWPGCASSTAPRSTARAAPWRTGWVRRAWPR